MQSSLAQRLLLNRLWDNRLTRPVKREAVAALAVKAATRPLLNRRFNRLGWREKAAFHARFCEVLHGRSIERDGVWQIDTGKRVIDWPLRKRQLGLDWGLALAVLGHDVEIKQTYLALASSSLRPDLFIDAGANYGTHAVLMATLAVPVLAFEPNSSCRAHIRDLAGLLALNISVEGCALGAASGEAVLRYPENASWLGSVNGEGPGERHGPAGLMQETVPLNPLDGYLDCLQGKSILLKLDVEGSELAVLEGAAAVLEQVRPLIIFESNHANGRPTLAQLLARYDYAVCNLPWSPGAPALPLTLDAFMTSPATNFLALPGAALR